MIHPELNVVVDTIKLDFHKTLGGVIDLWWDEERDVDINCAVAYFTRLDPRCNGIELRRGGAMYGMFIKEGNSWRAYDREGLRAYLNKIHAEEGGQA